MYVIMTHDVDWPRSGPGIAHILARRDRFGDDVIQRVKNENFNPYHGIPYIVDIEKELEVRSTFFFRPVYDDSQKIDVYESEIKELLKNGWEVGLHINSARSLESIGREKEALEAVSGSKVVGSRAHYLRIAQDEMPFLRKAGFLYDSSVTFSKDRFDLKNTGYIGQDDDLPIVFPITFMDAYLFSYCGLSEDNVVQFVLSNLKEAQNCGAKFATILWHDNSVLMRGGRVYRTILEKLIDLEGLNVIRGVDAYHLAVAEEKDSNSKDKEKERRT